MGATTGVGRRPRDGYEQQQQHYEQQHYDQQHYDQQHYDQQHG
jgi:hypothetical protein